MRFVGYWLSCCARCAQSNGGAAAPRKSRRNPSSQGFLARISRFSPPLARLRSSHSPKDLLGAAQGLGDAPSPLVECPRSLAIEARRQDLLEGRPSAPPVLLK